MLNKITCFISFSLLALAGCTDYAQRDKDEKAAANKVVSAYYDTRKTELTARQQVIDSILGSLKDEDENADSMTASRKATVLKLVITKSKKSSSLAPLDTSLFFLTYLEEDEEGNPVMMRESFSGIFQKTTYRHNRTTPVIRSAPGEFEIDNVASYKEMFDDFMKRKYLVVIDCIYYKEPVLIDTAHFDPGEIIKEIKIYNLTDGKLVDDYIINTSSSEAVTTRMQKMNQGMHNAVTLKSNLSINYRNALQESLFLKTVGD